jgi:hypothetical protein
MTCLQGPHQWQGPWTRPGHGLQFFGDLFWLQGGGGGAGLSGGNGAAGDAQGSGGGAGTSFVDPALGPSGPLVLSMNIAQDGYITVSLQP